MLVDLEKNAYVVISYPWNESNIVMNSLCSGFQFVFAAAIKKLELERGFVRSSSGVVLLGSDNVKPLELFHTDGWL